VVVIDAKSLTDVVGMVPFHGPGWRRGDPDTGNFFPVEKMSLMTSTNDDEDDDT